MSMPVIPQVVAREAWATLLRERALLIPLAGLLILLPQLALYLFVPPQPAMGAEMSFDAYVPVFAGWLRANMAALLLIVVASLGGQAAITALLVHPDRPTVGRAAAIGLAALPTLLFATLVSNLAVAGGLFLLVLPGLYLVGRLFLLTPTIVAEGWQNPVAGTVRAVRLTRGMGWMLFAFVAFVWLATNAVASILAAVALAGPVPVVSFVALALRAAAEAFGTVVNLSLAVAVYRRVAAARG